MILRGVTHTARGVSNWAVRELRSLVPSLFRITAAAACTNNAIVESAHLTAHRDTADTVDNTDAVRVAEAATSYGPSCSVF